MPFTLTLIILWEAQRQLGKEHFAVVSFRSYYCTSTSKKKKLDYFIMLLSKTVRMKSFPCHIVTWWHLLLYITIPGFCLDHAQEIFQFLRGYGYSSHYLEITWKYLVFLTFATVPITLAFWKDFINAPYEMFTFNFQLTWWCHHIAKSNCPVSWCPYI